MERGITQHAGHRGGLAGWQDTSTPQPDFVLQRTIVVLLGYFENCNALRGPESWPGHTSVTAQGGSLPLHDGEPLFPPSSSVRETPSWSRPSTEITPVIPGTLTIARGGWAIQTTTVLIRPSLWRPLTRPCRPSYRPYTRLSTGSQDKLSAQPFCAPVPGLGLRRNNS